MKKFFFCAAAAILALASCSKTQVVYNDAPQEIGFKAVTGVMTKDVQATGDFDQNIGVLAYNTADLSVYFANAAFEKTDVTVDQVTTTTWNGQNKYWPIDSKLDFVVYSPYQARNVAVTNVAADQSVVPAVEAAKTLEVTVATNAKTSLEDQTDYLYGSQYYDEHSKAEASVAVNFKHALALITVNFTCNEHVNIVSAVLDDTAQDGTYTVNYLADPVSCTWVPGNTNNDLILNPTKETALSGDAIPTEYMVVPTAASSITIVYNLEGMTGENLTKVIDLKETWKPGTHYTYNVNIGANEIKFTTLVTDWTSGTVTTDTEIE